MDRLQELVRLHRADDTRRELQRWIDEIASTRTHGTTHRRPIDLFADERAALLAIPDRRFELVTWHHGRVHLDTHVAFDKRLYSVPWRLIGQMVWVRATAEDVVIFADDVRVTRHDRRGKTVRSTYEEHLPENRAPWRHRDRAYRESRADQIYVSAHDMLTQLRSARADATHERKMLRFTAPEVLIVDDLGLRPLVTDEPIDLYEIIRQRHERWLDDLHIESRDRGVATPVRRPAAGERRARPASSSRSRDRDGR